MNYQKIFIDYVSDTVISDMDAKYYFAGNIYNIPCHQQTIRNIIK